MSLSKGKKNAESYSAVKTSCDLCLIRTIRGRFICASLCGENYCRLGVRKRCSPIWVIPIERGSWNPNSCCAQREIISVKKLPRHMWRFMSIWPWCLFILLLFFLSRRWFLSVCVSGYIRFPNSNRLFNSSTLDTLSISKPLFIGIH